MWKKRGKLKRFSNFKKDAPKGEASGKNSITCYECKKPGHMKSECPMLRKDAKRTKKKKAMMATWEDLEETSSDSDEDGDDVASICLMENEENEVNESNSSYEELLKAFDELLHDSKIILSKYALTKKANESLQKENELLKSENESLKGSSYINLYDLKDENEKLHKEVESLTNDLAKFVQGKQNLDKLLGKQRCVFNKAGLGFNK